MTFRSKRSPTATQPITYLWEATGQAAETHTGGGLSDSVAFTWNMTGTKTITVTATNAGGSVTDTHPVVVSDASGKTIYLPLVIRGD